MSANPSRRSSISVLSNFSNSRTPEDYAVDAGTTAGDLIRDVLARHNMLSKDPHLLYVTLDALGSRGFPESSVELKEDARLLQRLQLAQRTKARPDQGASLRYVFVMHMRSGGLLKIHDSCIMPGSFYNSLYVSIETTSAQAIGLLLASYGSRESGGNFRLVAKDARGREVRRLSPGESPLAAQQQNGREVSIHLERVGKDAAAPIGDSPPPVYPQSGGGSPRKQPGEPTGSSRNETLARLRESFRDLQRLREQNPELYDRALVAGGGGARSNGQQQQPPPHQQLASARGTEFSRSSARFPIGQRGHHQRMSGHLSARPANTTAPAATSAAAHMSGSMTERRAPVERRGLSAGQQPSHHHISKRQLPQVPSDSSEARARRLKLELEAQRQLTDRQPPSQQHNRHQSQQNIQHSSQRQVNHQLMHSSQYHHTNQTQQTQHQSAASKKDFQCQAFEEAGLLGRLRAPQNQPSLREILANCEVRSCQLSRRSRSQPWGISWQEVQFGDDVNANHQAPSDGPLGPLVVGQKPAIGRRQRGAFQRNERLLKYMRTLVAVQSLADGGAAAASGELRPGDMVVELNGCLATGMAPDQIDEFIGSELSLDLLVASSSKFEDNGEGAEASLLGRAGAWDAASELRHQLRQLQLRCNELAIQNRVGEQVIQRLKGQLTKTAPVSLLHQQQLAAASMSRTESEQSFKVIRDRSFGEASVVDTAA